MTIRVRAKPLVFVADALYAIDRGRGGAAHRMANRLVDACTRVTT